jgi:hypothetical protein
MTEFNNDIEQLEKIDFESLNDLENEELEEFIILYKSILKRLSYQIFIKKEIFIIQKGIKYILNLIKTFKDKTNDENIREIIEYCTFIVECLSSEKIIRNEIKLNNMITIFR